MTEIPDSVIHWLLGACVPLGGALFIFLLKRTFTDFENKISNVFTRLEQSLQQTQAHDTKIQLHEQRITVLEKKRR
ncbi:MAG: hypothetical protein IPJ65_38315 [Archangiaceae bacterium]|nr:hypothetical protein [Archangiaceae bacterium]